MNKQILEYVWLDDNKGLEGKTIRSKTKIVEVASAGMLFVKCLEAGDGCVLTEGTKLEWVCNLSSATQQTFYLQPGNYRIEWRSKSLKGSIYSIEKKFSVRSDQQTNVDLYR